MTAILRKLVHIVCLPIAALLLTSCATRTYTLPVARAAQLQDKQFVYEVLGHLYRWYLDEVDVQEATRVGNETLWVRQRDMELDPGDRSHFGELLLPVLGVSVLLKKADYTIEEIGVKVLSERHKIVRVSRVSVPRNLHRLYSPVEISGVELREYLFNRRGNVEFPNDALIARLRSAVRVQVDQHLKASGKEIVEGVRQVHCAPLSPVANEIWVFWEAGRILIRFASDLDLANPHVWDHDEITARIFDIDEQVVVSLQEAPGSNAYLTRDQVGRALYNCIVLGQRYMLAPLRAEK